MITDRQDPPSSEITARQRKILQTLIEQYINEAQPISSEFLKKEGGFAFSPATIRNELQELAQQGYISQPHTSAGRVPTNKGYRYFIEIVFSTKEERIPDFILKEIESTKEKIEKELSLAKELTETLQELSGALSFNRIEENMLFNILKIMSPSRINYTKNMSLINDIIKEIEQF